MIPAMQQHPLLRADEPAGAFYKASQYVPPYEGAMFPWESAVSGTELASAPWCVAS